MVDLGQCPFCGEERFVDLFEVWPEERAFQLDTCCEESQEDLRDQLAHAAEDLGAMERVRFLEPLRELFELYGMPIRQAYASRRELAIRLDWGLTLGPVRQKVAKAFIGEHHRHNPPPPGWKWGHGLYNGDELVGICWVGRPVARALDHTQVLEVNRLCVRPDLDPELVWNACSMLYAAAAREAKGRGYQKLITYTLESEDGTSLRAAGWEQEATTRGGSWDTPSRRRTDRAPTCPKVRWARELAA